MSSLVTKINERLTGRVKWFNNKAGYGFITITDGVRSGTDIFVHHTAIIVVNQQYKYLVQGEYVEFSLTSTQGETHEYNATNVTGVKNCGLMCETNRNYSNTSSSSNQRNTMAYDDRLVSSIGRCTGNYIKEERSYKDNSDITQYNKRRIDNRPPRIMIPSTKYDVNPQRNGDTYFREPIYQKRDVGMKDWTMTNNDTNNTYGGVNIGKTPRRTNVR